MGTPSPPLIHADVLNGRSQRERARICVKAIFQIAMQLLQKERIKLQRVDLKRIFRSKIANEKYVYVREKREAEMILYRA